MPTFDLVPKNEAELKTASGKRAMIVNEYIEYLNQLQDGQAGRLQPVERRGHHDRPKTDRSGRESGRQGPRNKALRGRHILLGGRCPTAKKGQAQEENPAA